MLDSTHCPSPFWRKMLLLSRFSRVRLCATPHRQQPTRLPRPWDSPGKNTRVGCHFLPQCMKVKSESEVAQSCPTLSDSMDCSPPGSSVHGIFQARVPKWVAIAFSEENARCFLSLLASTVSTMLCTWFTSNVCEINKKHLREIKSNHISSGMRWEPLE